MEKKTCELCPRRCGVDRREKRGACRAGSEMRICRIAPHYYEEPPISGTCGSGTIFFSGCSLDCEFCQNYEISKRDVGKKYSPLQLSEEIKLLEKTGVHNVNFVSPTHYSDKIIETLKIYRPNIPIVYNTSGYELPSVTETMSEYVDIFLVDLKYSDNLYAKRFSKCGDYVENCLSSIDIMIKNKPLVVENGLMKQGVIIRHLVLPENIPNTLGVINLYEERYLNKAYFSVMSQFVPVYKSEIKRVLSPLEYKIVYKRLEKLDTDLCFIQEPSAASVDYIPEFSTETDD